MKPETNEQKLWFFMGAVDALAKTYADKHGCTQEQASQILLDQFLNKA